MGREAGPGAGRLSGAGPVDQAYRPSDCRLRIKEVSRWRMHPTRLIIRDAAENATNFCGSFLQLLIEIGPLHSPRNDPRNIAALV